MKTRVAGLGSPRSPSYESLASGLGRGAPFGVARWCSARARVPLALGLVDELATLHLRVLGQLLRDSLEVVRSSLELVRSLAELLAGDVTGLWRVEQRDHRAGQQPEDEAHALSPCRSAHDVNASRALPRRSREPRRGRPRRARAGAAHRRGGPPRRRRSPPGPERRPRRRPPAATLCRAREGVRKRPARRPEPSRRRGRGRLPPAALGSPEHLVSVRLHYAG